MHQAKISSTKQKNYPDLGSNTLSAQNFFTHSSHVILQGNQQQYEQNVGFLLRLEEKYSRKIFHQTTYHSDSSSHSLWWKVMPEFSSYNTTVSVGSHHFSPHHTDFTCFLVSFGNSLSLGTIHKCNTFAKVEVCFFFAVYSFYPYEGCVGLLIPQASLVAKDNAFGVKA